MNLNKYDLIFVFVLFLFLTNIIYAQNKTDKILTDTSFATGFIEDGSFIGDTVSPSCLRVGSEFISKRVFIIISDVITCSRGSYSFEKFYEIYYKNKKYYIEKNNIITDQNYYDQISSMPDSTRTKFRNKARILADFWYHDKLNKAIEKLTNTKSKGLAVIRWSFYDESEYTEGTSAKITVFNPTNKVIKYLWFTFIGYNPVGDIVGGRDGKKSGSTVKGVGPIEPSKTGTYEFDYVWFSDLVETVKLSNIKVQYMDGSVKNIKKVNEITMDEETVDYIMED